MAQYKKKLLLNTCLKVDDKLQENICGKVPTNRIVKDHSTNHSVKNRVVRFRTSFRNTIFDVMKARNWKESIDSEWDFYWADRDYIYDLLDNSHLEAHQKVNHFRNGKELCRKDLLAKNLKRQKRKSEKAGDVDLYDFFPITYSLPAEYPLFVEAFKKSPGVWIMKPIGSAQGKGIFLFTKLNQVSEWKRDCPSKQENNNVEAYVVQKYISNPYLVGGKKFDLRIYALVTSFSPLDAYLCRRGFARFTNEQYSNNPNDIANSFIHLTNVAIQKTSENYDKVHGGKWDLRSMKLYMFAKHGVDKVNKLFYEMQMIIVKTLLSVQKIIMNDKHCFELYGYDILIDDTLKPWLLEVNGSPSLSANTAEDYQLKTGMLNDMLDIIDMENKMKSCDGRVGAFDPICQKGIPVTMNDSVYSTFLGADLPLPRKPNAAME